MASEPKKRHSRQRQGKRRASIALSMTANTQCANCGSTILPHIVCPNCGFYKGKQVVAGRKPKQS